jgi:hypothetical protein
MTFFDRLERRAGWLAFPGFLRYYALFHVLVFVLQLIRPDIGQLLEFDRDKILAGEVWRVATQFFAQSQFGRPGLFSLIFLYFGVLFVFMVSDGLENAWGTFKTSLFYYVGILAVTVGNFVVSIAIPGSGLLLYASAFLAFATLFPKVEILLFMILPVQVRFLGMFVAVGLIMAVYSIPLLLPFYLLALANYFIWAGIPALRGTLRVIDSAQRRKRFAANSVPASEAFHTCAVCHKTDVSNPQMEFRIGQDGVEYCTDHLPEDRG